MRWLVYQKRMNLSSLILVGSGIVGIAALEGCCGKKSDSTTTDTSEVVGTGGSTGEKTVTPQSTVFAKPRPKATGGAGGTGGAAGAPAVAAGTAGTGGAAGARAAAGAGGARAAAGAGGARSGPVIRIPGRKLKISTSFALKRGHYDPSL